MRPWIKTLRIRYLGGIAGLAPGQEEDHPCAFGEHFIPFENVGRITDPSAYEGEIEGFSDGFPLVHRRHIEHGSRANVGEAIFQDFRRDFFRGFAVCGGPFCGKQFIYDAFDDNVRPVDCIRVVVWLSQVNV